MFEFIRKNRIPSGPPEFIIAGLGNPGAKYEMTRHNAGFMFLDRLADRKGVSVSKLKFHALMGDAEVGGKRCLLMKPQTFMNLSGDAVAQAAKFYKIPAEKIIVVFDDVSLETGGLRIRLKGSAGGHNGIKSIIAGLGSENFPRIKLGVGERKNPDMDLANHVLSKISGDDEVALAKAVDNAVDAVELMVQGKNTEAMNKFNRSK